PLSRLGADRSGRLALLLSEELVPQHLAEAARLERLRRRGIHELAVLVLRGALDARPQLAARERTERFERRQHDAGRDREGEDHTGQDDEDETAALHGRAVSSLPEVGASRMIVALLAVAFFAGLVDAIAG